METLYFLLHQCQASLADSGVTLGQALSASATLVGASLGAGIGALGAYKATAKAGFDLVRRQKLEEAITELERMRHAESPHMVEVFNTLRVQGQDAARDVARKHSIFISFGYQFPLLTLIEIYFEEGEGDARNIQSSMMDFGMRAQELFDADYIEGALEEEMRKSWLDFKGARDSLLEKLKASLKSKSW